MAIAFVQGSPTGGITGSYASPNAAGNLLVCSVVCWDGATYPATNSVSDSRNGAWTKAVQSGDGPNIGTVEIWYRENSAAGSNTVTLTTNVGAFTIFNIAEFSGVATSGSLDKTAGRLQSNLTAPSTGAVTTTGADLVVCCVSCSQDDLSPGAGFSLAVPVVDGNPFEYLIQSAAGSVDGTFVSPGNNGFYGMSLAAFLPAGGGGGSSFTKSISETYSLSDSLRRLTGRTLSDTASLGDSAARVTGKGVSDSVSLSDLFASVKTKLLALLDSLGVTDSLIRAPRKIVAESLTVSDSSASKGLARGLVDALSIGDTFSAIRARLLALADSLGLSDAFARSTGKNVADSIGISDAFARAWSRILGLTDSIAVSDTVQAIRARLLALADSLGLTDALSRSTGKRVADSIGISDAFSRAWSRILGLTDSIAVSDTVQAIRARLVALSESLGLSDSLGRSTGKRVADSIGVSDTFARAWSRILSLADSIATTDVFTWFRTSLSSKPAVKSYIVQAWSRLWSVASAARTWIATEMTIHADIKRPTSIEDFMLDWSAAIGQDGIISSAWTIPAGLTAVTQSATGTTATVRLSGGVASRIYTVTNTVTLASGQVKVQDILIPCA